MDTCIYIGPDLQLLPQMVNVWVDALSSQKKMKGISSQVCMLYGRYLFQSSPCVVFVTC
jgi:hypothetical protein